MNSKSRIIIAHVISALFVLLFVYAALSKLEDFEKFRIQLGKSPVLTAFAGPVAYTVPAFELFIAATLMIKRSQYKHYCGVIPSF